MDKEIKTKWVEALRSGDYEQGIGYLCRDGKYCCLGVLAHINGDLETSDGRCGVFGNTVYFYEGYLPLTLLRKYGLVPSEAEILIKMNDIGGNQFDTIAVYIEENL